MINNRPTKADYVIQNGDLISNVLHRYAPRAKLLRLCCELRLTSLIAALAGTSLRW